MTPRGIRNNNPGNIDYSSRTLWNGLDKPPTDGRFCRFVAPEYGLRVISKLLLAYAHYHGCQTVRDYIDRWAPPVENDTSAYVMAVADDLRVDPDDLINIDDPETRAEMMEAIIHHENGQQPYARSLVLSAATMP